MSRPTTLRASRSTIMLNKVKTFFSKPHNVILLLLGIVLTFTTPSWKIPSKFTPAPSMPI